MNQGQIGLATMLLAGAASAQLQPAPTATSWTLFFDWGKAEIRSDDQAALDQAAEAVRVRPGSRVQLTGHTDRSGSAAVNRLAGLRRAQLVGSELQRRGVPRNAISIASLGEQQPLVPTEDGVREVQNRRVAIEIVE